MGRRTISRLIASYGMAAVLVLLCAYYSWATLQRQQLSGAAAAKVCAAKIQRQSPDHGGVLIVAGSALKDLEFSQALTQRLQSLGIDHVSSAGSEPRVARQALQSMLDTGKPPAVIAATEDCANWLPNLLSRLPALSSVRVVTPGSRVWPTFLTADNLLNVANQIVVIAVIAVGMTMVIITGGIDLSVGSLVAFSAVVAGLLIRDHAGGNAASPAALIWCSLAAVAAAGAVGAFSGAMVAFFRVPPFIATLAVMQIASGEAYILASGSSIYEIPQSFVWLGRGASFGVPNAISLMVVVYVLAYFIMSRTRLGRYIYAVGGNAEAARLSGVRVWLIILIVYMTSGIAAGIGGVVLASQLKAASATYGLSYELAVIAAVVVGGTSLSGGSGKILGTLIGALIIAIIQNGMNLTGVESYRQRVVLGYVILGAVLLDAHKHSWRLPYWLRSRPPGPAEAAPRVRSTQVGEPPADSA